MLLPAGVVVLPHETARFLGSRWSFHLMGTRELPRGFSVSLAMDGREGVPLAWYRQVLRERAGLVRVPVSGPGTRTADLVTGDFLLAKEIAWDRELHLNLKPGRLQPPERRNCRERDSTWESTGRRAKRVLGPGLPVGARLGVVRHRYRSM